MRLRFPFTCGIFVLACCLMTSLARAEWSAPRDNQFTEKQLVGFIEVTRQFIADSKAAQAALQGQTGTAGLVAVNALMEKRKAAITAQGMTEAEFNWLSGQVAAAYGAALRDHLVDQMKADSQKQIKANEDKVAEQQKMLEAYQKAQSGGRRVMTADERKDAVDAATQERRNVQEEARQHQDELKSANDDLAKALADQKMAESEIKNPPKFNNDDERSSYMQEKMNALQAAKDAQKDANDKIAQYTKSLDESRAKVASIEAKIANPDLPVTDDEKSDVKKQNGDKIQELVEEIKNTQAGNKLMQDGLSKELAGLGSDKNAPPAQNVELFKKHEKEYTDALSGLISKN